MPLLSPKRRVSDVENKLRVLFCLKALGLVTQEQLWPFVAQMELMDYLPFCLLLDELKSDGAVAEGNGAVAGTLYLTPEGEKHLTLFQHRLIHTDCQRILQEAPKYAAQLNERRHMRAGYERAQDDCFRARCMVLEEDVPTLLVRLTSRESSLTQRLVKGFDQLASRLLTLLYTLPVETERQDVPVVPQEQAIEEARPGHPLLCGYGGSEHGAAVCLRESRAEYTLLLLWPDEALARQWALAADRQGEALAKKLTQWIDEVDL